METLATGRIFLPHITLGEFWDRAELFPYEGRYVGGTGMLSRPMKLLENIFPGLRERIGREKGRIVVAGHGLNTELTECLADHSRSHALLRPPVLVDTVNYQGLIFGSGSPPVSIRDAALVLSCCGPVCIADGLRDQIRLLAPGGELLVAMEVYDRDLVEEEQCQLEHHNAPEGVYSRIVRN